MPNTPKKRAFGTVISGNRKRGGQFSSEARAAIIAAGAEGRKQASIAKEFNTSQQTISKILNHFTTTGEISPEKRKGRPKKLSPQDIQGIKKTIREQPRISKNQLVSSLPSPVDTRTITSALDDDKLRLRRAIKKIYITPAHTIKRLSFISKWIHRPLEYRQV